MKKFLFNLSTFSLSFSLLNVHILKTSVDRKTHSVNLESKTTRIDKSPVLDINFSNGYKFDLLSSVNMSQGFLYQTKDGTIYLGTRNDGLKKFNPTTNALEDIYSGDVHTGFMHEAQDGTIYVGTYSYLMKFNETKTNLEQVNSISFKTYLGFMYQIKNGDIYVSGLGGGHLAKLNADGTPASQSAPGLDHSDFADSFMFQAKNNDVYLGVNTTPDGLVKLSADGNSWIRISPEKNNSMYAGFMFQASDGKLYAGSQYGLWRLNSSGDALEEKVLPYNLRFGSIVKMQDGNYLLSAPKDGFKIITPDFKTIVDIGDMPYTTKLYKTNDNTIYMSNSRGLFKLSKDIVAPLSKILPSKLSNDSDNSDNSGIIIGLSIFIAILSLGLGTIFTLWFIKRRKVS